MSRLTIVFHSENAKREALKNAEEVGFSTREPRGPLPSPEPTDRVVRAASLLADSLERDLDLIEQLLVAQRQRLEVLLALHDGNEPCPDLNWDIGNGS